MKEIDVFYKAIKEEMTMVLATSDGKKVTMRTVSPVYCDEAILFFTDKNSQKFLQLQINNYCCVEIASMFCEAKAEFLGGTMLQDNEKYRKVYDSKFPGAFDEGVEFGGRQADFILLHPCKLTGWKFSDENKSQEGIPSIPFEIKF